MIRMGWEGRGSISRGVARQVGRGKERVSVAGQCRYGEQRWGKESRG